MELYIGIDWDRKKAIAVFTVPSGKPRRYSKPLLPHKDSIDAFLSFAHRLNPQATTLRLAIEAGSPRWARLFHQAGACVHLIDCKQARRFAESLSSSGAKDDTRDAYVLLEIAQSKAHRRQPWAPPDPNAAAMLQLVRLHQQLSTHHGRVINRLRAHLAEHFPALDNAINSLSPRWFARLMRAIPTPSHALALDKSSFETVLRGSGIHRRTRQRLWAALQQTEVLLSAPQSDALALAMTLELDQLVQTTTQLAKVEAQINEALDMDPRGVILKSVDGIGLHLSAGLLALCFDGLPTTRHDRDRAAKRLGAVPVTRHSGQQRHSTVRMRRSCATRARQIAYRLGMQATQRLSWAKAMYIDARKRNQSAGTAFRRISRCVLRILTAMLRDGTDYDDARYIQALKDRGISWAQELEIPKVA